MACRLPGYVETWYELITGTTMRAAPQSGVNYAGASIINIYSAVFIRFYAFIPIVVVKAFYFWQYGTIHRIWKNSAKSGTGSVVSVPFQAIPDNEYARFAEN